MVTEIRVYDEGDRVLAEGFNRRLADLRELAKVKRVSFRWVAGEAKAVADFMTALESHADAYNVLLIDAEGTDDGGLLDTRTVAACAGQPPTSSDFTRP